MSFMVFVGPPMENWLAAQKWKGSCWVVELTTTAGSRLTIMNGFRLISGSESAILMSTVFAIVEVLNSTLTGEDSTVTVSLALPTAIAASTVMSPPTSTRTFFCTNALNPADETVTLRSEEHTSELQSPCNLVCRLLLEKKKKTTTQNSNSQTHKKNKV